MIFSYWIYWTFLAEQQALISSWRHIKPEEKKVFSPTNSLITLTKCRLQNFPHMTPFTVNFVAVTEYTDCVNFFKNRLTTEQAVVKLKLSKRPPSGFENYQYLQQKRRQELMSSFKDFLRWYNNKDVVPSIKAMQKMFAFHHDKDIDMLKLGCTLPNLAIICLHKSTDAKFYPFTEGDKDLLEKYRENDVGGPSIVFTRKAVADETFIRKTTNFCKSFVRIDASQLYPYAVCQPMPTGLHPPWNFDSETTRFIRRQNQTRSFENMVMSYLQRTRPECETQSFFTTGKQKKIDFFCVDKFCSHCNDVFEAMGCFYHFCPCLDLPLSLTEEDIQRGSKKRELDALRRHYIQEKALKVSKMRECQWWRLYITTNTVKQPIREHFVYRRSLATEQLLEKIKEGKLFGYLHSDIEVPENLRSKIGNFPPMFKNALVSKSDIGDLMKNYAEEERLLSQPRKMWNSSFTLQTGTLITPLLLFYLQLGLVCTKLHRFVKYTPKKSFNSFVQSAVDAGRQGDENSNSSVVAETMKLLVNSSYGYQIMDRNRQTVTKYLTDKKTDAAITSKLFKKLDHVNKSWYEVELAKAHTEHKELIFVGFFILHYAKLRMLELYYNFFTRFCDVNEFEEQEKDTDSLYLALAAKKLEDCTRPEMRMEAQRLRSNHCVDSFTADAVANFFRRTFRVKHKQHDKREPGLFKEEFSCTERLCLCTKTYCCKDVTSNKLKFSCKGLNKRVLEQSGGEPLEKYRRVERKIKRHFEQ